MTLEKDKSYPKPPGLNMKWENRDNNVVEWANIPKFSAIDDLVTTLNSAALIKQKCCVACMAGKNDKRALYIASSESCQPNRNLFGLGTKLKESIFKSNNQINSTVTTRT